jgi:hypothetical protein
MLMAFILLYLLPGIVVVWLGIWLCTHTDGYITIGNMLFIVLMAVIPLMNIVCVWVTTEELVKKGVLSLKWWHDIMNTRLFERK